jgi:hypothetical protein
MSGELDGDVYDAYFEARKLVEGALEAPMKKGHFGDGLVEIAFIPMILGPNSPTDYKEVKRYNKRQKTCEFRLIVDHDAFKDGSPNKRAGLLCESLLRALSLLAGMKTSDIDIAAIEATVISTARKEGWLP